jgi:hypothetical protein
VLPPGRAAETLGSDAPIPLVKLDSGARSDAPIPLVRRSMVPVRAGRSVPPTALPADEGVAASWRSRPPPVDLVVGARAEAARAEAARVEPARAEPQRRSSLPPQLTVRERLEQATAPEAVLELLRDALAPAPSIVFAIKSASFEGRIAAEVVERRVPAKQLSLLSHQPSVLETAVKSGFYLGPIPNTPNHRELRDALPPDAANEVYVTVITVSDRPSLVWLIAGFEQSLDLTRRADEVALAAGRALARILRDRKRGA